MTSNQIEVILTPSLYPFGQIKENIVVVVVDVFRAGTTICSAFAQGVEKIIPVGSIEEVAIYKEKGCIIVGERDGIKLDFADYGNSPTVMKNADLENKTLVLTTTNGTKAIEMAKGANQIAIGAFTNLSFISEWILTLKRNVIILCSGWQETVSLEDTLFAGALTDLLVQGNKAFDLTDSAYACIDLWNSVRVDIGAYLQRASHYQRLVKLGAQNDLDSSLRLNSTRVIPVFENYYLINILK